MYLSICIAYEIVDDALLLSTWSARKSIALKGSSNSRISAGNFSWIDDNTVLERHDHWFCVLTVLFDFVVYFKRVCRRRGRCGILR